MANRRRCPPQQQLLQISREWISLRCWWMRRHRFVLVLPLRLRRLETTRTTAVAALGRDCPAFHSNLVAHASESHVVVAAKRPPSKCASTKGSASLSSRSLETMMLLPIVRTMREEGSNFGSAEEARGFPARLVRRLEATTAPRRLRLEDADAFREKTQSCCC